MQLSALATQVPESVLSSELPYQMDATPPPLPDAANRSLSANLRIESSATHRQSYGMREIVGSFLLLSTFFFFLVLILSK
jgi:hypothetical protein